MKKLLNIFLALVSITYINVAMAENRAYVPVLWDSKSHTPQTFNMQFDSKNQCDEISKQLLKPTEKDKDIYLHECTKVFTENQQNSFWFVSIWQQTDKKPIVLPIALEDKKICNELALEMNDITKSTIKTQRNYMCKSVVKYSTNLR